MKTTIKTLILISMLIGFMSCDSRNETVQFVPAQQVNTGNANLSQSDCPEGSQSTTSTMYLGTNIISNGSFEEGHNLGNNQWNVFDQVGAWYADSTYNDAGIEIQNGQSIGGLAPSHGDSKLEFDAHNRNGFTASDVSVYQDIDTDAADDYILTFDYSPRVAGNEETNAAEVFWDGDLIASLNSEVKGWQTYTLIVKGAGNATRLAFKGYIDNNTVGGYLDNVKLKKIHSTQAGSNESVSVTSCVIQ